MIIPIWSNVDSLRSLNSVLKDVICLQYFYQFLQLESTAEYLLCWIEIDIYRDTSLTLINQSLINIYNKFLKNNAIYQLQSSYTKQVLEYINPNNQINNQDKLNLLINIQHENYNIMNSLFTKFINSLQCEECLQSLQDYDNLRDLYQRSHMISLKKNFKNFFFF